MSRRGFTLIELVMVIVIIGILAVGVVPRFTSMTASANNAASQGALAGLRSACVMYYANQAAAGNTARFPSVNAELQGAMADSQVPVNKCVSASETRVNFVGVAPAATVASRAWIVDSTNCRVYAANNLDW